MGNSDLALAESMSHGQRMDADLFKSFMIDSAALPECEETHSFARRSGWEGLRLTLHGAGSQVMREILRTHIGIPGTYLDRQERSASVCL
jgi:hypothetical protein